MLWHIYKTHTHTQSKKNKKTLIWTNIYYKLVKYNYLLLFIQLFSIV